MELLPGDLLKIINGYAIQGADYLKLAELYEELFPHIVTNPLYKEEERNKEEEIKKRILKIISGEKEELRNMSQRTKDYAVATDGVFNLLECYSAVDAKTAKDKNIVRKTLSIMCDNTELERIGAKTGNYLAVDKSIEYTDYKNIKCRDPLNLILPLDAHKRTLFFPSCILGIAGCTGNGKTTWAFNIIRDNQDRYKIKYFYMPELGPEGLSKKLGYFITPIDSWKFDAICGSNGKGRVQWDNTNIHQKIFLDCLNIIDYLEPPEDAPWKIFHVMNKIAARLNNGMAIILIQKKEGAKYGVGGDWSAKATSFYLSLEWGNATVQKNTYQEEDMIGRQFNIIDFDIGQGSFIKPLSGWYSEHSKKEQEKQKTYAKYPSKSREPGDDSYIKED